MVTPPPPARNFIQSSLEFPPNIENSWILPDFLLYFQFAVI